jgi:hypothetical protein
LTQQFDWKIPIRSLELTQILGQPCEFQVTQGLPIVGEADTEEMIDVSRVEVEALAAQMFAAQPLSTRTLAAPPTLEEMLVTGSEAQALLSTMFVVEQPPQLVFPTEVEALAAEMFGGGKGNGKGGRRNLQSSGPQSQGEAVGGVRLTLRASAPTVAGAEAAVATLVTASGGRRRLQDSAGTIEHSACGDVVTVQSIDFTKPEIEALAAQMFAAQPPSATRTLAAPPLLEEMLVTGSEAQALLSAMFVAEQPPYQTAVTAIAPVPLKPQDGHRRQLQSTGPQSQGDVVSGVRLTLRASAPTPAEADKALRTLTSTLQMQGGIQDGR